MLLRNFSCGKRDRVYAFDKWEGRVFQANVKNVACERGFYDLELDEYTLSLEPTLGELESRTGRIIQRIGDRERLALSVEDRAMLSVFAAVQLLRGPNPRDQILDVNRQIEARLRGEGQDPTTIKGWKPIGEQDAKTAAISLLRKPGEFAVQFTNKDWVLLRPPKGQAFYISDSPVVLQNERPRHPLMGNLGLAVAGIEIYLPLSKTLTLAFLCPSHCSDLREGLAAGRNQASPHLAATRAFLAGVEAGTAVNLGNDELARLNGLQVANAARFVFASTEGFRIAKEMIRNNPRFKTGPRSVLN